MTDPRWVFPEDVEDIHEVVVDNGGGSHRLRDAAFREPPLGRPQNQYAYAEADSRGQHPGPTVPSP